MYSQCDVCTLAEVLESNGDDDHGHVQRDHGYVLSDHGHALSEHLRDCDPYHGHGFQGSSLLHNMPFHFHLHCVPISKS